MSLWARLDEDLKHAMRKRDTVRRSAIRYLRSAIQREEIDKQVTLDDEGVIRVLSSQAQQRRDSIEAFKSGDRLDLVEKEQAELDIILEYLPEQMSRDDIAAIVQRAIDDVGASGPQDMGRVMGVVMPQVTGRAEGREVSTVVSEMLKSAAG